MSLDGNTGFVSCPLQKTRLFELWEGPIVSREEKMDDPDIMQAKRAAASSYVETASSVISRVLGDTHVPKRFMLSTPDGADDNDDDDDDAGNYDHTEVIQNRYIAGFFDDYAEMYRKCHGDGVVRFHLCDPGNPGCPLDHADDIVEKMLCKYTMKFKIGITVDPYNRWYSKDMPGYKYDRGDKFEKMLVLAVYHTGEAAGVLERHMIKWCKHKPGCANMLPGGESTRQSTTYLYVVFRVLYEHQRAGGGHTSSYLALQCSFCWLWFSPLQYGAHWTPP